MKQETHFPDENQVLVGKITKPHGIKGEVKAFPYSGIPENFSSYSVIFLICPQDHRVQEYEMRKSRTQGRLAVLKLAGIESRTGAESLAGCEIWVNRQEMAELDDDEFYWDDLVGMEVATDQGIELGKVRNLLSTGAHDILVIVGNGREYMIPLLDDFVVEVDQETGKIVVDPPEGLLEINS